MRIWVDADGCPKVIKEILFRAAERTRIPVTLVANRPLWTPASAHVHRVQVSSGSDVADRRILDLAEQGDLVITADVPLAAGVVDKGAQAISPRGDLYTRENVAERLSVRNLMDELRGSGVNTGGPPTLSKRDRQAFANQLDRLLAAGSGH